MPMSIASLPSRRLDEQRIASSRLPSQRPYRLVRNWGRIGTAGQAFVHEMTEIFATEAALEVMARVKRRRGVIRICERAGSLAREGRPSEVPHVGVNRVGTTATPIECGVSG